MTVASQEANLLSELLQTLDGDPLATLAATFLTKAVTLIADPWAMSAIPDFIYAETTGERPPDLGRTQGRVPPTVWSGISRNGGESAAVRQPATANSDAI